jgi:hypothetical protein
VGTAELSAEINAKKIDVFPASNAVWTVVVIKSLR